ncbi:hypothetical protein B7R21_08485 [Subtercola boreus]|uniref:Uncharacterized protein n=1 Tax=Subtercola boreus TaxID=120213 RepID=A0A3E0VUG5_9MICO|nr:hypothetical protein B7R21_08485 [Subtercola boreus]
MNIEPRDEKIAPPLNHPIEPLVKLLREDLFDLTDGLLPPHIVDHVTQSILVLESLSEPLARGSACHLS